MINSISFGSTYKVHTSSKTNELRAFDKFEDLCAEKEFEEGVQTKYEDRMSSKYPYNWEATRTLIVPEDMDSEVETYCKRQGIEFKKYISYKLLDSSKIEKRIEKAPKDMIKVQVDVKKLEHYLLSQSDGIKHSKNDYDEYYKDAVNLMLKSADAFPATTLCILPNFSDKEDVLDYIKKFGAENLNDHMVSMLFTQRTDEPDNCIYFALKDLGMNKIPVYVDKDSYELGNALGLFE